MALQSRDPSPETDSIRQYQTPPPEFISENCSVNQKSTLPSFTSGNSSEPRNLPTTYQYLQWTTPIFDLYPFPEQLPKSVTNLRNPFDWSKTEKNLILALACFSTSVAAYTAGAYTSGLSQMGAEWGVSRTALLLGITTFTSGFAIAPMVLAPLSEVYGRRQLFIWTYLLFNVCHLSCALCKSFPGILLARFFLGVGGSTFSTMVGGVISDIYHSKDRGFPMSLFSTAALFGTGLGPLCSGFINDNLSWRWIHWIQLIVNGVGIAVVIIGFRETRGSVLLSRKAKALNRWLDEIETSGGEKLSQQGAKIRWKAKEDEEMESLVILVKVSLTRPFYLLFTEPVVFWFSLWVSFSWGVLYLLLQGVPLVFTENHNFTTSQVGSVFTAMCVGSIIALGLNSLMEHLTKRYLNTTTPNPEARLYSSCIISCCLPIGMFWFGWTSFPSQPWILPTLAIGCATIGIYSIYLAVFNYLADSYHRYASSALAAQSFCRNMLGGAFPLFTNAMYHRMTFAGASSFLGGVSALLTIVPWILVFYGPRIRGRSKFAKEIMTT